MLLFYYAKLLKTKKGAKKEMDTKNTIFYQMSVQLGKTISAILKKEGKQAEEEKLREILTKSFTPEGYHFTCTPGARVSDKIVMWVDSIDHRKITSSKDIDFYRDVINGMYKISLRMLLLEPGTDYMQAIVDALYEFRTTVLTDPNDPIATDYIKYVVDIINEVVVRMWWEKGYATPWVPKMDKYGNIIGSPDRRFAEVIPTQLAS